MTNITIGFRFVNEFGESFNAESSVSPTDFFDDIDLIGQKLNCFLRQVGFCRQNNNILMNDLSDDELEALSDYLEEYRASRKE